MKRKGEYNIFNFLNILCKRYMNLLLIFFAIPIATIILSVILQTLICCPFKVAGIAFSIFIVVAFALGGTAALIVAAIIYTIISFISAVITMFVQNRLRK